MRPDAEGRTPEELLLALLEIPPPEPRLEEIGTVSEAGDGVAVVSGLSQALSDELLAFASGVRGIVFDLEPGRLGVVLLGPAERVRPGEEVRRTGEVVSVPVGPALLGRVVDALGNPLDGRGPIDAAERRPVEAEPRGILERAPVSRPLATGLKAVDAAVPIGLGQRQLIIGDRQTGKSSLAIDAILNQRRGLEEGTGVRCVYCGIGQRGDAIAKVIGALAEGGMTAHTVLVNAGDEDAPGLSWIAPYAAMTIAESLVEGGEDVLLVLDDLSHHAHAYRELSLLLRRAPGREAFPGDIFYVHARLLERAGQFTDASGGGSVTALPVVETQAGNLSAYIPTNLISITDGQIYLSPRLVRMNQFPAVDLGVSVSRVGGKAQSAAMRDVAGNLRVTLSQFEELEEFARFGTRLDPATRARLARGAAVRAALRQPERDPQPADEQLAVLVCAMEGVLDGMDEKAVDMASARIRRRGHGGLGIAETVALGERLSAAARAKIVESACRALAAEEGGDGADA